MNNDEPDLDTLYEFATVDHQGNPASTEIGWWNGYAWIACFTCHAWSPEYVLSHRRVTVVDATYEPAAVLAPNKEQQ
jgi:hypothetical protein